jgi:hypothetical protein
VRSTRTSVRGVNTSYTSIVLDRFRYLTWKSIEHTTRCSPNASASSNLLGQHKFYCPLNTSKCSVVDRLSRPRVDTGMTASQTVGRRLRRYLGALLALGFGTAWWSFTPPARTAAAAVMAPAPAHVAHPKIAIANTPLRVMHRTVALTPVKRRPHRVHVPKPPVIVIEPIPVSDPIPVVVVPPMPEPPVVPDPPVVEDPPERFPPITTRSS